MASYLDMSPREFRDFISMVTAPNAVSGYTPDEIATMQRTYRAKNSPFANLFGFGKNVQEDLSKRNREPTIFGLASKPSGTTGYEALTQTQFEPKNFIANILDPVAKAVTMPSASYGGQIPSSDAITEALNAAGFASFGGAVSPKTTVSKKRPKVEPKIKDPRIEVMFTSPVFHYMNSNEMRGDTLIPYAGGPRFDRLGPHVGTKDAALARYNVRFGELNQKDIDAQMERFKSEGGQTLPLLARTDKPLLNKKGKVMTEFEARDYMQNWLDNNGFSKSEDFDAGMVAFRKNLTDQGFTNIPYINAIEDAGSISHVMLTDRTAGDPAVLRSKFADFSDAYDPSIMAANRSKSGGVLGFAIDEEAQKQNKEVLDPLGYQDTKLRKYLTDTDVSLKDVGENKQRKPMSWEDMEGKVVIPFYGDRTSRGLILDAIDEVKFDSPVYTEGGVDFMVGPAAQADKSIWASNSNIITRLTDTADAAKKDFEGKDIVGLTGSMAPNANDFATFTGEAMAEMIQGAKITKKGAKEFNDIMKLVDKDFVGVRSPKLREYLKNTTSEIRKSFIRLAETSPMQKEGFPSSGQVRYAVTDPTQRDFSAGMFGLGAARVDTNTPPLYNTPKGNFLSPKFPHSTYNTQMTGEYLGSLPPVHQSKIFKDVYDAMEGGVTKSGQPFNEAHKTHAIKTKVPAQLMTPQIIDGILEDLLRRGR